METFRRGLSRYWYDPLTGVFTSKTSGKPHTGQYFRFDNGPLIRKPQAALYLMTEDDDFLRGVYHPAPYPSKKVGLINGNLPFPECFAIKNLRIAGFPAGATLVYDGNLWKLNP